MLKDTKANKIFMLVILIIIALSVSGHKLQKSEKETFNDLQTENELSVKAYSAINLWVDDSLSSAKVIYNGKNKKNIEVISNNGKTSITEKEKKFFIFNINWEENDSSISIYLPSNQLNQLYLSNVSDDINTYDNLDVKNLNIHSISGDINLLDTKSEKSKMSTVSGDINLTQLDSNDTNISSVSGEISIENLVGDDINIKSVSGNIELEVAEVQDKLNIKTTSGDIDIEDTKYLDINYSTVSGTIEINGKIFEDKKENPSSKINLSTVSGDIEIN